MQGIAAALFTKYVFAFEVTSALLITAAVGAMILAHIERRREREARPSRTGCGPGSRPGNYPGAQGRPGRLRHLRPRWPRPARLPDGRPSDRSMLADPARARAHRAEAAPKGTEGR